MTTKARITTDFPSQRQVASRLRIPADRAAELKRQLFDLHITHPDGSITVIGIKNSAGNATAGVRSSKKISASVAKAAAKKK